MVGEEHYETTTHGKISEGFTIEMLVTLKYRLTSEKQAEKKIASSMQDDY